MTATEHVILVDESDNEIGVAEKLQAHREGLCHRAFSVFIIEQGPELRVLLQQRADNKYHSGGLWTNTCCSHPRVGEDIIHAGERRLKEEMGLKASLRSLGKFHYLARFSNGLVENEVDHVLVGEVSDLNISPNPLEVQNYRWISIRELKQEMSITPDHFTPWLALALEMVASHFSKEAH